MTTKEKVIAFTEIMTGNQVNRLWNTIQKEFGIDDICQRTVDALGETEENP